MIEGVRNFHFDFFFQSYKQTFFVSGGAIITFPNTGRRDKAKPDDYRLLLQYLMSIPR